MFVGMIVFCIARFSICSPKYRLWVCISCSLTVQVPELSFVRSRHGSVQAPQGNCCMAEGVGVLFQGVPRGCGAEQQLAVHLRRFEAAFLPCTTACAECHLPCTAVGIIQCMHMAPTTNAMPSVTSASTSCTVMNGMHVMAKLVTAASTCVRSSHMHTGIPCALAGKATNCNGACAKMRGHAGDCDCECGNHICGAKCDLPGCEKRCTAPWGGAHDRHRCGVNSCPEVRLPPCVSSHVIALPL